MPVSYDRDDARRLITVTATDPYMLDEVLSVIDRQAAEHAWAYAMLSDLRAVMDLATLTQGWGHVVNRVQLAGGGQPRGPVGIAITPRPGDVALGLQYSRLASQVMDVEVLLSPQQIEDWLTRHVRRASSPPSRLP